MCIWQTLRPVLRGKRQGVRRLKSLVTAVCHVNYVLPRKGEIVLRCPGWKHVTWRGRVGRGERRREDLGRRLSGCVSAAPTPTSCPPSCSCYHILPRQLGREWGGGSRGRALTWDVAVAPLPCPCRFQGCASALCPGWPTLWRFGAQLSALLLPAPPPPLPSPPPPASGLWDLSQTQDQSPIPGLAQLPRHKYTCSMQCL